MDMNYINSAYALLKKAQADEVVEQRRRQEEQERIDRQNAPIIKELKEQNELLRQELKNVKEQEEKALKEAKRSNRNFWISTGIAIAAIVVSAVLHFVGWDT